MADGDDPERDALDLRKPRTDWLLRRGRMVVLAFVAIPLFMSALMALRPDGTDGAGDRLEFGAGVGVCVAAMLVVWVAFAIRRWGRASRARRAAATAAPWRDHGYWSQDAEERFVALGPSRVMTRVRRLLEVSGWFAFAGGTALAAAQSRAAIPAFGAGLASLAVVFLTGMRGYVNVCVVWREHPARTGESAHFSVSVTPAPRGRFENVEMTLRCVVETPRRRGLLRPSVSCPFSATRHFADELPDAAITLHARFDVPPGLPGADPYGEPAVFWELVVAGERPGSRFDETFLVPVYAPPS